MNSTLDPQEWQRVQHIFHAALEREGDARSAFLDEACGTDRALREQVESLLRAHRETGPLAAGDQHEGDQLRSLREALEDRYDVVRQIGSGGMATVYLAHDLKHNRQVAIKVLHPWLAASLGGERFLREIEIAAGLQHPHILPLYDSGVAGSMLYYVMPYVEGNTLLTRVSQGPLPARDAIQVSLDVLSALEYAHRRGVVHRDIKPANILMSASGGHAMVADFGIARAVSAAGPGTITVTGAMMGTPGYMAPEQAAGAAVTPATDVYAVGVVLYECFTGRRWPMPERPQDANWSGVPASVQPVLRKALEWAPGARWSDASEFRHALLRTEHRSAGRQWRLIAALGVVAVLLGVGVASRFLRTESPAPPGAVTRLAVLPFTVRGSTEFAYLAEGLVDLLSTKLDGAGNWRSVDPRAVLGVSQRAGTGIDPATGRTIAEQLNADLYVLGNVVQVGEQLRLDASLYDSDRGPEAVIQASVEGNVDDVLDILDDLAAELLAAQPEMAGLRLSQLAMVTSGSLTALKAYLSGVTLLRAARYQEAADALRAAIAVDSTFALAWYQLGIAADWLQIPELSREATRQALGHAERLTERNRRLLEARGAVVLDANAAEAERRYRLIIGTYPTDVEAWSQLGELLLHWGPQRGQGLEAAREPWGRLLELEPDRPNALVHLARIEAAARDEAALDAIARRFMELAPEGERRLEIRLLQAYVSDDATAQARVMGDFQQASDDAIAEAWWSAGAFIDDLDAAATLARIMTEESRSSDTRVVGFGALASVALAEGQGNRVAEALDAMEALNPIAALEHRAMLAATSVAPFDSASLDAYRAQLRAIDWDPVPPAGAPGVWYTALDGLHAQLAQYLIGLASARIGDGAQALAAATALQAMEAPDGYGSLIRDWARSVRATVAWQSGDVADALREIEQFEGHVWYQFASASPFLTLAYERFLRARLLEENGRLEDALRWYGSFEGTGLHERIFVPPSHWRRGHVYERLGDRQTADTLYARFLELWDDVDAEFRPLVEDARERLGGS